MRTRLFSCARSARKRSGVRAGTLFGDGTGWFAPAAVGESQYREGAARPPFFLARHARPRLMRDRRTIVRDDLRSFCRRAFRDPVRRACAELLEQRRLLAADAYLVGTTLFADGSDGNDTINVFGFTSSDQDVTVS